jgi:hypothetical protein
MWSTGYAITATEYTTNGHRSWEVQQDADGSLTWFNVAGRSCARLPVRVNDEGIVNVVAMCGQPGVSVWAQCAHDGPSKDREVMHFMGGPLTGRVEVSCETKWVPDAPARTVSRSL